MEKEFYCYKNNQKIYVKEYMPDDLASDKIPAVIISHGFGGSGADNDYYCKAFVEDGYAAYCFDFCGGTVADGGRSDGAATDMSVNTECDDLSTVYEYVASLSYIDEQHITLMGISMGGFVSGLTAAKYGDRIENLIMIYPAICIPDDARMGRLGGGIYDLCNVPDTIECPNGMTIGRRFHEEVKDMDPYLELRKMKGRVLLIQGTNDGVVNYSYAVKAKESYQKGQCQLLIVRNAGHGFSRQQEDSVITAMKMFLAGKKEYLTIQVFTTEQNIVEKSDTYQKTEIYFTGYCDNELFKGSILPGAVDVQEYENGGPKLIRADYTLEGIDQNNEHCKIHIINQKTDGQYKPEINTNSPALSFLKYMELTASLEIFEGGLTVRIFG